MTNYPEGDHNGGGAVLASRLRAAREASGLTQAQAAGELGVSRPLLIAIEKGTREASPEEIVKLAEIYGKPANELLRPSPPPAAIGTRFRAALSSVPDADKVSQAVTQLEDQADNYLDLRALPGYQEHQPPGSLAGRRGPGH
jgi:transcriptional regulator with XRE-family HTH domain